MALIINLLRDFAVKCNAVCPFFVKIFTFAACLIRISVIFSLAVDTHEKSSLETDN